ncbi:cytochrome c [Cobetia sp. 5-11-6-3]|uniref:cytochrome c n=1 Tax=Cobetia sp. 5-11-6-3 TaxID=2737458 RepID=UPI001C3F2A0D|nr:cytochrome c [Cobetia sp. 5-11-6-3]
MSSAAPLTRVALLLAGLTLPVMSSYASAAGDESALLKRGEYLARAGDCAACHRAPEDDGPAYAGGYVIESPLGDIVASNITPSNQYGIGDYSEEDFARVLTEGERPDGSQLYPAMPYTAYRGLMDEDIHALYAYFQQGVAPVDEPIAETNLSFPFNLRAGMIFWNLLFLDDPYTPQASHDAKVDRGHYLVDTLGHCGSCHTPRNALMAQDSSRYLAGADVEGWHAPNITSAASGIGRWSEENLATYLKTGHVPGLAQAGGGMADAVDHSLRYLTDEDLASMAAYLKQVPAIETGPALAVNEPREKTSMPDPAEIEPVLGNDPQVQTRADTLDGRRLYQAACASCHQRDGQGTQDHFYPSLVHNTATRGGQANNLVMAILKGVDRQTEAYHVAMPAYEDQLTDAQVAAISNHVLQKFGNAELTVDAQQVAAWRQGGSTPWWVSAMPWLLAAGAMILLGGLGGAFYRWRRHAARY